MDLEKLHKQALIIDGHCDSIHLFAESGYSFGKNNKIGHIDLPRLVEGGVNVQFFAVFVEKEHQMCSALRRSIILIEHFHREIEKNKDKISLILDKSVLDNAISAGKIAALLSLEGGEALGQDIEVLYCLYRLGIRSLGLTWNGRNMLADGVSVGSSAGGLTPFGKNVVAEMNKLGMVVDAAHLSPKGFYELLDTSASPVVVTHANAAGVCNHPRNLDDNQLQALNEQGGVIGLSFFPAFISEKETTNLESLLDHFCYIAHRFGTDMLGIGSDYDGIEKAVPGLEDVSRLPFLTQGLLARGFADKEIAKILGRNFLRVLHNTLKEGESQ